MGTQRLQAWADHESETNTAKHVNIPCFRNLDVLGSPLPEGLGDSLGAGYIFT